MNIILIGFKGSGKSTVGALLARLAGKDFLDTDGLLERLFLERDGRSLSCREIYRTLGASFMRELEAEALGSLSGVRNTVIATGGGVVLEAANVNRLARAGLRVFLDVPVSSLKERLAAQADSPLFRNKDIARLHAERYPLYLSAADVRHEVPEGSNADETARALYGLLRDKAR